MSLSTLLEAAKYLDYLDSSNYNQQQQQTQQHHQQSSHQPQFQTQPLQAIKKSSRRQRFSKKNAANTMVAMSLPASTGPLQMHGVSIPLISPGSESHQAASLSSSFTTGSPLSSFASTALFCSKASGVTSASSSAASSLSSSDSSSSCGEILMGDNDFNQSLASSNKKKSHSSKKSNNVNNNSNYHLTHQTFENNHQIGNQQATSLHQFSGGSSANNQSIARFIAATSTGPQLVTMTTSSTVASTSAPIDGSLRAGHVIHAATNSGSIISASPTGSGFDPRHFSVVNANGIHHQQMLGCREGQTYSVASSSFGSDNQLNGSPGSCPPLIMARVQPMILNSLSPSAHQSIMAFQPATASSPTSSSSSYSRHRELHKTLEKNRRAHLRHCFELLKAELPASECVDKKTSHINIIKSAIRYVLALRQQECEIDNELQRLTKIKTELTESLAKLRPKSQQQQQPEDQSSTAPQNEQQQQPQLKQEPQQQPSPPLEPHQQSQLQQPVAEQQLSFLLSQSKID